MNKAFGAAVCLAAAMSLTACDGAGRKYPPGYTDNGIKFDEDGWRFFPGERAITLSYFPTLGSPEISIRCNRSLASMSSLRISTGSFQPLQQWPQPGMEFRIGEARAAGMTTLKPVGAKGANIWIIVDGRERARVLAGIKEGSPITLTFDDQVMNVPGPPESMRTGFVSQCKEPI